MLWFIEAKRFCKIFYILGQSMHHTSLGEPGFVRETLKNVTVPEGRDVLLSCTVKNLDSHKVRNMKSFYTSE